MSRILSLGRKEKWLLCKGEQGSCADSPAAKGLQVEQPLPRMWQCSRPLNSEAETFPVAEALRQAVSWTLKGCVPVLWGAGGRQKAFRLGGVDGSGGRGALRAGGGGCSGQAALCVAFLLQRAHKLTFILLGVRE